MEKTCIFFLIAILACYKDIRERVIPNWLTLSAFLFGFFCSYLDQGPEGIKSTFYSVLIAFSFNLIPFLTHNLGAGDLKLFTALASFTNPQGIITIIVIYCILVILIAINTVFHNYFKTKKISFEANYPFAPVITGAFLLHLLTCM